MMSLEQSLTLDSPCDWTEATAWRSCFRAKTSTWMVFPHGWRFEQNKSGSRRNNPRAQKWKPNHKIYGYPAGCQLNFSSLHAVKQVRSKHKLNCKLTDTKTDGAGRKGQLVIRYQKPIEAELRAHSLAFTGATKPKSRHEYQRQNKQNARKRETQEAKGRETDMLHNTDQENMRIRRATPCTTRSHAHTSTCACTHNTCALHKLSQQIA
jgi:hypothetical protein